MIQRIIHNMVWIVVISVIATVGYWGIQSFDNSASFVYEREGWQPDPVLSENSLAQAVTTTKPVLNMEDITETPAIVPEKVPETSTTPSITQTSSLNQQMIKDLDSLIAKQIVFKEGTEGLSVGIIQKFLNVYNSTSNRIDNDYGPGTAGKVTEFQKAQGLTADGQAGPGTISKMKDWLTNH